MAFLGLLYKVKKKNNTLFPIIRNNKIMETWNCEVRGDHTTLHILLGITHYF